MKGKIVRLNPEKTKEWFVSDRDFLNSTYQDNIILSAITNLKPENDVFVMRVGLPEWSREVIEKNNTFYNPVSYNMFVDILPDGNENQKKFKIKRYFF